MIGVVVVLALSLPFVINQVLKQQDVRQRADSAPAISFNWGNPIQTVRVGDTVTIGLLMNVGINDIGALHFKLNYSTGFAGNVTTSIAEPYKAIQQNNQNDGVMELTLINPDNFKITGSSQNVMKFTFKALKAGEMNLSMDEIQATASLQSQYVPVENAGNIIAKITVVDTNTQLSPTVTTTTATSPTPQTTGTVRYCGGNDHVSCEIGLYSCYVNIANGVGKTCTSTPGQNGTYNCIQCILATPTPRPTQAPSPTPTPSPTPSPTPTPSPSPTPLPTSTPIPTPTVGASETIVKVAATLPGIGNTISGDNNTPHTTTRQVTAMVYDAQNALVPSSIGVLTYNSTNGKYEGQIGVGVTSTTSASYRIKLKLNNTLFKFIPGIITIVPAATTNVAPSVELVPGDLTGASNTPDNSLDILDYNLFQACYRGQAACTTDVAQRADFNDDGVVNGDDVDANILSRGFYIRNGD